jgi:hypothetical protein
MIAITPQDEARQFCWQNEARISRSGATNSDEDAVRLRLHFWICILQERSSAACLVQDWAA